ncbi:TetR family transcriptional regulator [Paenibacillus sp. JX-17]|uniref:TetR family transcriptional regulator n=1 Tax=Paenibacillus lacisoli TaxID=3064525 RepID=A0ABT9CEK3_9BACL|nr:TetR family transcriptional regulator [Paenibacillus sp. JX-17]MDO7907695.1 TetR family transcriptional regulator [Paenibacillus sp. JX-17]
MSPKVNEEYKEQKKREILNTAIAVFTRKGYTDTTMKDIVEESGMSRGAVYSYFSSTEEMMVAILGLLDTENQEQLQTAVNADSQAGVWDRIENFIQEGIQDIDNQKRGLTPALYEFFLNLYRQGKSYSLVAGRYDAALEMFAGLFQRGVDAGEFKPLVPVWVIAAMMITMMDGLVLDSCMLGTEKIMLEEQMSASLHAVRHLLGVDQG